MTATASQLQASREFFYRRLHSLLGVFPVGVFLIVHLGTNYLISASTATQDLFQEQVDRIHALGPFLIPVEIALILLPLGFHAFLGLKFWLEGRSNIRYYQYWGNYRYTLQRLTGVITFIFIGIHLWQMHWIGGILPGGGLFDAKHATETTVYILQSTRWWSEPVYAIGIIASCFHFADGLWTFLITWGLTIGHQSQRKVGMACGVMFVALTAAGLISLRAFVTHPSVPKPEPRLQINPDQQ